MQRASSENQGECWHAKRRRKNERKGNCSCMMRRGGMQRASSENQGECWHAKTEERMKERETAVEVEKSKENLCMWNNNIMCWNQDGGVVESESKRELWMGEKEEENLRHRRRS
jgi:hypothetical protein